MSHRANSSKRRIAMTCALTLTPLAAGLTACGSDSADPLASAPYDASSQVAVNTGDDGGTVDPDKPLEVTAKGGEGKITDVTAVDAAGRHVAGELSADGGKWHSTGALAAGVRYTAEVSTENEDGEPGRRTIEFETAPADTKKIGVTFGPDSGTYGVGQPITAELSHKIKDPEQRKIVEGALKVTSTPKVEGAWHWVDGKELHYRPKSYWPAHASISVRSELKGLKVREGLYGGAAKPLKLKTGDRVEAIADGGSKQMRVVKNGETVKSIPITTGKAGFRTRTGTKVILGLESFVRMRGTSIGIAEGSSESYDLPVRWATRLTWSGEYVHGAPWSVGSQGSANVSHGCTGMNSANAKWFFDNVKQGDLVTHVNTSGEKMAPFGNGFGDWNMPWKEWQEGSAVLDGQREGSGPAAAARLRPQV
ncbi:Ig-like domain-containing protein [Streptomyces sp. HNM0574]|uniref:L,D-transpeptidase n=1 Tax=Streptomyces sp. HNM0574 TaxID=2714954 RepID=UPI00146B3139|nr:Ig-like domain-containing protein [Streptomyces sp. HNM0574]NLU67698.1 L,D-transpeptidase [Streptomyces sp. HNM0574]